MTILLYFYKKNYYFCNVNNIIIKIITRAEDLPYIESRNFFHSPELFNIIEQSPSLTPYMVLAMNEESEIKAHLLTIIRRRGSLIPPYLYTQAHIYGEGEYSCDDEEKDELFNLMLQHITKKLQHKLCLFIEISNLSTKMFGYRNLRNCNYFPIHWMEVHNSLHSLAPEERISHRLLRLINKSYKLGVITREVESDEEVKSLYRMLRKYYKSKVRKFIPPERQISEIEKSNNGKLFVTLFKNKVIGGSACIFSEGNAYLWYVAYQRKSHPKLHPDILTIWNVIKYSYDNNYAHIRFMDVGLPFKKSHFRDFILKFGGKPVSSYRWFRFSISWMNNILSWIYRE
jgi:hypothetical protein